MIELKGALPYPFDYLNMAYKGKFEDCPLPPDAPAPNPISYVRLQGFDFEVAEQDAVRIRGARRCEVLSCRATNLGNIGVNIGAATSAFPEEGNPRRVPATGHLGGATGAGLTLLLNDPGVECRVEGCDLWSLGNEGIMLVGTNNVAENNHVYDIGLYVKDEACINLLGDGNIARRNTVHDCPHTGIFLKGVNNVVEMNDVHHTVLESCDMGGIRMVQRNVNLVGNVIRNNRVFDSVGYGCFFASTRNNALQPDSITHFESPYDAYGIYLDDITCGTTIEDNIVARASRCGINIHGGSGNTVVNNVFVDNGMAAIEFMPFPNRQSPGVFHMGPGINQTSRNILASQPPCIPAPYHFMNMTQPKENPVIENNLIWCAGAEMIAAVGGVRGAIQGTRGLAAWLAQGIDHGSIVGDPLFVDPAHDDYRLKPDSPAYKLGFQDIPMDQIGCYASPARASWPIAPNYDRVREKPVLYQELGWKPGAEPRQGQSPASRPRQ
ncbi:MAG: right-handed parallel beta-helix repeat-containing protein [Candidatus Sumerlaeota bacterium]|nr:right-handed parallel beta-helix repeat-containing protein [Candidatus Sumerlaeota bacterium]